MKKKWATSGEERVASLLDEMGARWLYEPIRFYDNPEHPDSSSVRPDFFVPEWNLFVEVKRRPGTGKGRETYRRLVERHGFRLVMVYEIRTDDEIRGRIAARALGMDPDAEVEKAVRASPANQRKGRKALRKSMAASLERRIQKEKAVIHRGPSPRLSRLTMLPTGRGRSRWQMALVEIASEAPRAGEGETGKGER